MPRITASKTFHENSSITFLANESANKWRQNKLSGGSKNANSAVKSLIQFTSYSINRQWTRKRHHTLVSDKKDKEKTLKCCTLP